MKRQTLVTAPAVCLTIILAAAPLARAGGSNASDGADAGRRQTPALQRVDSAWLSHVQADIQRSEYKVTWQERTSLADVPAAYQAPNRANNFRTHFTTDGIRVVPRPPHKDVAAAWEWGLSLNRFGRAGAIAAPPCAEMRAAGNRVEYHRGNIVEWYINDEQGLEQGFTINEPPAVSSRPDPGEPGEAGALRVDLAVTGNVTAELTDDGAAVDFLAPGGALAIRFENLHAMDAKGRALPTWFEVATAPSNPQSTIRNPQSEVRNPQYLAIVVDDTDAVYPITIDPLALNPAWTAESNQAAAEFGISVAGVGDVNGDGYNDVIVGAHFYDNGQTNEGRTFVYHGSAAGLAAAPAWTAESDQDFAEFGISVATAGDVNGDGYSDVIVGAYLFSNGQTNEGRAYVYLGSAAGLAATPAWMAESNQDGAFLGGSVATAGDVNGDGYSDVIVGASFYDNGQADEGAAFVWLGSPAGLGANGTPANAHWFAEGDQASAFFGNSVAMTGDVNGDGYSDVIVGASSHDNGALANSGRAYVYLGAAAGLAAGPVWIAQELQDGARLGSSVATAGDINGDGYSDIIVGASRYDNPQVDEGRAYVWLGTPTGPSTTVHWIAESDQTGASFGGSVATAGDVNGDGYSDVIVGASSYDNGQNNEGRAFVWFGSSTGLGANGTPTNADWSAESNQADAGYGGSVATAGDINGDGYSDVIVGALNYDNPQTNEGRAFVYRGSAAGPANTSGWSGEGDQDLGYFGISVASAGDVNGDGYGDVIVGSGPLYALGLHDGGVSVYLGTADGLSSTATWTANGEESQAEFGRSVASAGDVNGDGYSDIIVGGPYYDNGVLIDSGRVFVWLGSPAGLGPDGTPANADWTAVGDQDTATFGYSVATAGDVNGDGYSDIIVGAPYYDNAGVADSGRVFVWLGSPSGLGPGGTAADADWIAEADSINGHFGWSVATAGDVNGDGYSDVIVGADGYSHGTNYEGVAFVWFGSSDGLGPMGETGSGFPGAADWFAESNQSGSRFGRSVATAGDVNGDGYSDVIVGADYYTSGEPSEGAAFVWYGSATGLGSYGTPANANWWAEVNLDSDRFGTSVASAGDVNGDGYSDVIAGADYYNIGMGAQGGAFLWFGASFGLGGHGTPFNADWTALGQSGSYFGACVASAGDVNGDGYSDVIVGASSYFNGETQEGGAFLYYGNDGPGLSVRPRQRRANAAGPVAYLGCSDSYTRFGLAQIGRTPLGRGMVVLQCEIKPFGTLMDGMNVQETAMWADTGTTGAEFSEMIGGLAAGTGYHWRVRTRYEIPASPFQQYGRWMSAHGNGWNEVDLRTPCAGLGDMDGDCDVDLADFAIFSGCMTGPSIPATPECLAGDFDADTDIDLNDLAAFQAAFLP